jgi:LPXTG-site transpeptidase (sortase) family protein
MIRWWVAAGSVVLVVVGATGIAEWNRNGAPADVAPPAVTRPVPRTTPSATGHQLASRSITLSHLPTAGDHQPIQLSVPAEQISGAVMAVGTDPRTHLLRVPHSTSRIVWWSYGALPGDAHGSVVLAAHVDYNGKLGLFFNLDRVPIGAVVHVRLHDGRSVAYRVDGRQHVDKSQLHRLGIFTRKGNPRLILITCGGSFNAATKTYADNIVVDAQPIG